MRICNKNKNIHLYNKCIICGDIKSNIHMIKKERRNILIYKLEYKIMSYQH